MSAIRPDLPVSFPTPQAPARAARSDFFRAALDAVQAGAAPTAAPVSTRTSAPASAPAPGQADRSGRPGALLDIRV